MTRRLCVAVTLGMLLWAPCLSAPPAATFRGAKWIWHWPDPAAATPTPPEGKCTFRTQLILPAGAKVASAQAWLSCDNLYALYVNEKFVGQSSGNPNDWNQPRRFDVAKLLKGGANLIAIEAANTAPGPAGLLGKFVVQLADGKQVALVTDENWLHNEKPGKNWHLRKYDDKEWRKAYVTGTYGGAPWGNIDANLAKARVLPVSKAAKGVLRWSSGGGRRRAPSVRRVEEITPPADYAWPGAIVYLGDDCSLYRPTGGRTNTSQDSLPVTIFQVRKSRSYPEHDLPGPIKMGRKLYVLSPARPGTKPKLLLDAGTGAIGSPTVSYDGKWIYVSMALHDEPFFHIYRLGAGGGKPQRLTDGPFHDIDPVELPDGRIVFTSTRIGTFEEYHSPPSRSLFVMNPPTAEAGADAASIHPLTYTFIFDNEAEVLADGRIVFIRTDDFFDRGKVETRLQAAHTDGTEGYTEFGLDNGPEYGGRLRAFYCGSPAPMPDGQLAFVSRNGITVSHPGMPQSDWREFRIAAGDVAALPDGRLICTIPRVGTRQVATSKGPRTVKEISYEKLAILDPRDGAGKVVVVYDSAGKALHSPVYLGPRRRPPRLAEKVAPARAQSLHATGVLFCQNVRHTQQTTAGWKHVRAIRVLAGKGLNTRSSHSFIVHAGSEAVELGTVPLGPDGSFSVEVPADTAIAFQAVDAEGRSELNEMSWIFVRPGERRGCVGCHVKRHLAPVGGSGPVDAATIEPVKLLGKGDPLHFRGNNPAVTGLMELQFDRYREVAGLNRHSRTADPLATGKQEVAELVARVQGQDPWRKITAAQRLSVFRDPAAAPALAGCLTHPTREVRLAAAVSLATCGTRDSVRPLLAALDDADPLVAQAAAMAIENLTGHAAAFDGFARGAARLAQSQAWRDWFAGTTWEAIEAELAKRVASPDRDVVRRAAVALGHTGSQVGRDALRAYVARERGNNPYPAWRKRHRGDGARFNSLSEANPRTLQAAVRALGYLQDTQAIGMLAETAGQNSNPGNGNLFLLEACTEALGRIGTPGAQDALVKTMLGLKDYFYYVGWYGDHSALYACHASPAHYFIAEGLDWTGSKRADAILPNLIRSVPTDPDRALMLYTDDCETLVGRVIRRHGAQAEVVQTCLAILGDKTAKPSKRIQDAIRTTYAAWGGKPGPENRAAQILALTCRDRSYEPRIRAALDRYRALPQPKLLRAYVGHTLPRALPVKHWVCFFLSRALGQLADGRSVDSLLAVLDKCPPEASYGIPNPVAPEQLFLHNDLTPCYRAAAAWALGRIGDRRAAPTLLKVVGDLKNAPDTRHAAAEALARLAGPEHLAALRKLAATYPDVSTGIALRRACERVASAADASDARKTASRR